jgi:hypothetical protein
VSERSRPPRETATKNSGRAPDPHRITRLGVLRLSFGAVVAIDVVHTIPGYYGVGLNFGDGVPLPNHDFDTVAGAVEEGHRIIAQARLRGAIDASEEELPPPTPPPTHMRTIVEVNEPHLLALGIKKRYIGRPFRVRRRPTRDGEGG